MPPPVCLVRTVRTGLMLPSRMTRRLQVRAVARPGAVAVLETAMKAPAYGQYSPASEGRVGVER